MKQHYKVTNWEKYNRSLINRGNIFLYFTPSFLSNWHNCGKKAFGRPREYSSAAIELFLTVRTLLGFPLRQTQGFIEGLIEQLKLTVTCPNYSLVCRRARELRKKLKRLSKSGESIHVLVDSSGLKIFGEGEWKMRTHGKSERRTWRKIHIAVDRKNKTIVSSELTEATVGDSSMVPSLLDPISNLEGMTGDGAYDAGPVRNYLDERKAQGIIPPDENAVINKNHHPDRNEAVAFIHEHGDNEAARKLWKQSVGYYQRSGVENTFFRMKTIFAPTLRSREKPNQDVESLLRCRLLNRMTELGMPISVPAT